MNEAAFRGLQQQLTAQQQELMVVRNRLAAQERHSKPRRRSKWWVRLSGAVTMVVFIAMVPITLLAATPFGDLNSGSVHNGSIDAIYNAGITRGCVPNVSYCPNGLVTREEMASFLARTAGLGGNAPVTNAATLNGFPVNTIVRTNARSSGTTAFGLTSTYQVLTAAAITIPAPGFVMVHGAANVYAAGTSGSAATVGVRVRDTTSNVFSLPLLTDVGTVTGGVLDTSVSPVELFLVQTVGARTFVIEATRDPSSIGSTGADSATLTLLYLPFGPGGAQAAESVTLPQQETPWRRNWSR